MFRLNRCPSLNALHWHAFATAVQFLTRLPCPGGMNRPGADPRWLADSLVFFPLIGGLIGTSTGLVIQATGLIWSTPIAVVLGLCWEAWLTNAFHEDAVADSADALGGGWSREQALEILKDSRIGSFGALALGLAVGLRAFGLGDTVTPGVWSPTWMIAGAAGALGRWFILLLMLTVPTLPDRASLSKDIVAQVSAGKLLWGSTFASLFLLVPLLFWPVAMLSCGAGLALWWWLWRRTILRQVGGLCGDLLGAGCYVAQLIVTLGFAARG